MKFWGSVFGAILGGLCLLVLGSGLAVGQEKEELRPHNTFTIDFEDLSDLTPVTNHYEDLGLVFAGATVLSQGESLNFLHFPPRSGVDVVFDDPSHYPLGTITVDVNPVIAGDVHRMGAYVTGNRNIVMRAYDANGNLLGSEQTGGANYDPVGIPNMLLEVSSSVPIRKLVFFNGGEQGNTFTVDDLFFESELLCDLSGVPLYKQYNSPWSDDDYGGTTAFPWYDPNTGQIAKFRDWGCAVTSAAMLVSYHGIQQNGFTTDPGALNAWLRDPAHKGYSGGNLLWGKVAEYARDVGGLQLYFYEGRGPGEGVVNTFLCNGDPMVLYTTSSPYSSHFVLATGQADEHVWSVNDPGGYNVTQLGANAHASYRKYSAAGTDPSSVTIIVHSPVELLITDPAGRRTGYDPVTGEYLDEILDAVYEVETVGTVDGSSSTHALVFSTGAPLDGAYSVQVIGTGAGVYLMDVLAYESEGGSSWASAGGPIVANAVLDFGLMYSDEPGAEVIIEQETELLSVFLPVMRGGE